MSDFLSTASREELVRIVKLVNPAEAPVYGAQLDDWVRLAGCAPGLGCLRVLVGILKRINPPVADLYGPMLDSWASRPANCYALAVILMMLFMPKGLVGLWDLARALVVRGQRAPGLS